MERKGRGVASQIDRWMDEWMVGWVNGGDKESPSVSPIGREAEGGSDCPKTARHLPP